MYLLRRAIRGSSISVNTTLPPLRIARPKLRGRSRIRRRALSRSRHPGGHLSEPRKQRSRTTGHRLSLFRNSYVSTLRPVVLRPSLRTSPNLPRRRRRRAPSQGVSSETHKPRLPEPPLPHLVGKTARRRRLGYYCFHYYHY